MLRLISLLAVVLVVGGSGYFLFKTKGDVGKAFTEAKEQLGGAADDARGYPAAKTPKEAADLFRKAIKERRYDMAAKYCTDKYAEILRKGDKSSRKLGEAIDNLTYQMKERGVLNDEMKIVLYGFDPFPKDITITVSNESEKRALATIAPEGVRLVGQSNPYATWKIDLGFWGALYAGLNNRVKVVKEGENWKLDFPTPPVLQASVSRLNEKYNLYVQKLEILSREVKIEADTKDNVLRRMKELLEDAAKD